MFHDLDPAEVQKKVKSYSALYNQNECNTSRLIQSLAETYLQMKADRDYWQTEAMTLLKEKRTQEKKSCRHTTTNVHIVDTLSKNFEE